MDTNRKLDDSVTLRYAQRSNRRRLAERLQFYNTLVWLTEMFLFVCKPLDCALNCEKETAKATHLASLVGFSRMKNGGTFF